MNFLQVVRKKYWSAGEDRLFRVDDESRGDSSPSFCNVNIRITDPEKDSFDLILRHCPCDEHVEGLAEEIEAEWSDSGDGKTLTVPLTTSRITDIRRLAEAIRKVVGRGRRYSDPNWKWVCRRTADSLQRFADNLKEYRHAARNSVRSKSLR